jgi:hypothetical protein
MDNSLFWAKELADRDQAPAQLFVVLGGPGPDLMWSPEFTVNPLRSERKVSFKLRGQKSALTLVDGSGFLIQPHISPDASNWYERHVARESELHELIVDSAYGGNAAINGAVAAAKITSSAGLGLGVGVGGSVLGAALVYIGGEAKSDGLMGVGLGIMLASIKKGWAMAAQGYAESTSELTQKLDPSETYRFVRYLPEYLWMGWSDKEIGFPVSLRTPFTRTSIAHPSVVHRGTSVSIAFLPDLPTHDFNFRFDSN